jgi:hypothetical protein
LAGLPSFVVISGGAAGSFYVRQLLRATAAGRLQAERVVVVDRDPLCAARAHRDPRVEFAVADWGDWLDAQLLALSAGDQLVPYHWAPHLLFEWLRREAARAGLDVVGLGGPRGLGLPYERDTQSGDRALSYATWPCPPACIEPGLCPHTRGPRDWSLAGRLSAASGRDEPLVFRSLHYAYGVATIPVAEIQRARERLLSPHAAERRFVVSTASHCHGLSAVIGVRPRS